MLPSTTSFSLVYDRFPRLKYWLLLNSKPVWYAPLHFFSRPVPNGVLFLLRSMLPATVAPCRLPACPDVTSMVARLLLSTYDVIGSILSVHAPKTCMPSMVTVERSVLMLFSRGSHAKAPRLMKLMWSVEARNSSTETAIFNSVSIFRFEIGRAHV